LIRSAPKRGASSGTLTPPLLDEPSFLEAARRYTIVIAAGKALLSPDR
jgi:hypothetical protein